jgi:hypothetical protein
VQPFAGIIDGESSAIAGPYGYAFDTAQTGTVTAAGSAARKDRLDVQVSDPAESDGSSVPAIKIIYTQGAATGGAVPSAPARSHALCVFNVPATGGGSPTISWAPDWSGDPGEWTFNTYAELTAYTTLITAANVPAGQRATVIADTTTANNGEYVWSGSIWIAQAGTGSGTVTPSTGWVNPSVLPGNSLVITPLGIDRIAPGYGVLSGILAYTGADVSGAVWGDRYQVAAISGVTVRRFTEVPGISGTGSPIAINVRTDGKVYFRYITTSTGTVNTSTWVRLDGIVVPILY